MSKRASGRRASEQGQADLFGATTAQATQKKTRSTPRAHAAFAQASSLSSPPTAAKGAAASGLLNVREAALRLGLSKSTLDKMRGAGKGPRFIKSTDRAVRYDPADLDAWIALRRRTSTSDIT